MPDPARPKSVEKIRVNCSVNGQPASFETYPMARLLDVLRENLKLTGTKEGCGEGECGACAIEMNGDLVNSCLVPALQAESATIRTIEGIANAGLLDGVQQSFLEHGGAQCGICTPGMILAAVNYLENILGLPRCRFARGWLEIFAAVRVTRRFSNRFSKLAAARVRFRNGEGLCPGI